MRNNKSTILIYASTWVLYLVFSFFSFPVFNLTVFTLTIPLSMLGGWFYGYIGAIITPLITILYNFRVLYFYVDHPENVGPMAVGCVSCTLFFSLTTTYVKSSQERLLSLNSSLRNIIDERTLERRLLVDALVKLDHEENKKIAILLAEPLLKLEGVLASSNNVVKQIKAPILPESTLTETVNRLIRDAIYHLRVLRNVSFFSAPSSNNFKEAIHALASQLETLSDTRIQVESNSMWSLLDTTTHSHLYPIIHESLINAVRHGNASEITIGIKEGAGNSVIYVENNGTPVPDEPREGMGLALIRYHATKIDAEICIRGGQGQNTILECKIPVTDQ